MVDDKNRKTFIIDTSVLLYDKNCIKNFAGNDVVLPLVVLEEIDKFKTREGLLGENARYVNRFLDDIRKNGSLHKGVFLADLNVEVKVASNLLWKDIEGLDRDCNDNIIIATANYISKVCSDESLDVVLITKDINLRVKCDAINIKANDYYADYAFIEEDNLFSGHTTIDTLDSVINNLYNDKSVKIDSSSSFESVNQNECVVLKSHNKSSLAIKKNDHMNLLLSSQELAKKCGIEPKNKEQIFALNILLDDSISLTTLTGVPGSGKTYLALMVALKYIEKDMFKRIIFTRPIQTVGKDIGFLPGSLNEKMAPWLAPIVDNFRNQFGDLTYFDMMIDKGAIDVAPLSYIRGRSFNDAIIIVDEAQNATVHELKTVITRTGKNSKIILLGDIEQVDLPYVNKYSNGLTIVIEKLKNELLTGHVNFTKGYRSELANIAAERL
jgi:PhoH-like ATPase